MTSRAELISRLFPIAEKIEHWRTDARYIGALAQEAQASGEIDPGSLQEVEATAGAIYEEIASFDRLVAEVADTSLAGAGQLAEVGDALRLVLMEITELGTTIYSVRSRQTPHTTALG